MTLGITVTLSGKLSWEWMGVNGNGEVTTTREMLADVCIREKRKRRPKKRRGKNELAERENDGVIKYVQRHKYGKDLNDTWIRPVSLLRLVRHCLG